MDADDSARARDLMANSRTLLAWIRTALSFAGLGFVVAKFGKSADMVRVSGYLGIFMTLVGLLLVVLGYAQYRVVISRESPPPGALAPSRWPAAAAAVTCALACALLTAYLAVSFT